MLSCRHSREVTRCDSSWLTGIKAIQHYLTDPPPAISFTKTGPVAILDSCFFFVYFFFLHGPPTASGPGCSCTACTTDTPLICRNSALKVWRTEGFIWWIVYLQLQFKVYIHYSLQFQWFLQLSFFYDGMIGKQTRCHKKTFMKFALALNLLWVIWKWDQICCVKNIHTVISTINFDNYGKLFEANCLYSMAS